MQVLICLRIERLAGAVNKPPYAFMIDVLSQEADSAELREEDGRRELALSRGKFGYVAKFRFQLLRGPRSFRRQVRPPRTDA